MPKHRAGKHNTASHTDPDASAEVKFGSGNAKKSRQLSFRVLAVLFVLVFGSLGSYLIFASHADTVKVPCSLKSGTKTEYNCTFYETAPVKTSANAAHGSIPAGTNYIYCQQQGGELTVGSYKNDWWAWTDNNQGGSGWVNAVYGKGGANDEGFAAAPNCNNAHGLAPLTVVYTPPAPKPTPAPVAKPTPAPVAKPTPTPAPTPAKPVATTISGKVYDSTTGRAVPGTAKVNTCNSAIGVITVKSDGTWSASTTVGTPFCAELQYTAPIGWAGPVLIGTTATSYEHQTAAAKNQSYDFKFTSPAPAPPKAATGHVIVSGKVYNATTNMPIPNVKITTCTTPATVTTGIDGKWYLQVTDGAQFCAKLTYAVPKGTTGPVLNNNVEHKTATDYESQIADTNDYHNAKLAKTSLLYTWDRSVDTDYNFVFTTPPVAAPTTTKKATTPTKTTTTTTTKATTTAPKAAPAAACTKAPANGKCASGKITCNTGYKLSGKSCAINNNVVIKYTGNEDGCGGTGEHYAADKKTHVAKQHDGAKSLCYCTVNRTYVAYTDSKAVPDSATYPGCSVAGRSGASSGVGAAAGPVSLCGSIAHATKCTKTANGTIVVQTCSGDWTPGYAHPTSDLYYDKCVAKPVGASVSCGSIAHASKCTKAANGGVQVAQCSGTTWAPGYLHPTSDIYYDTCVAKPTGSISSCGSIVHATSCTKASDGGTKVTACAKNYKPGFLNAENDIYTNTCAVTCTSVAHASKCSVASDGSLVISACSGNYKPGYLKPTADIHYNTCIPKSGSSSTRTVITASFCEANGEGYKNGACVSLKACTTKAVGAAGYLQVTNAPCLYKGKVKTTNSPV